MLEGLTSGAQVWKHRYVRAVNIEAPVLITGCSSGIGRATALRLARAGRLVYATARRLDGLDDLTAAGCKTLRLDVTDGTSMRDAVAAVERDAGAVGVLVNNAGYSQSGAIESVPLELVRRQFETNVFGAIAMMQLVLPGMRRRRSGTIVNVSSMGGRLTFPGGGYYHATKYALEALTDALRFEVGGFGIRAILIEPGLIRSEFAGAAVGAMAGTPAASSDGAYAAFDAAVAKATEESYRTGPLARLGGEPDDVARTIERALVARRPRARYTVTPSATVLLGLRRILGDAGWDRFLQGQFAQPR
jgi:NAD(P)-dependent dehydrogenase (short-subunit alcohol dehydrogenase family)